MYPELFKLILANLSEADSASLERLDTSDQDEQHYDAAIGAVRAKIPTMKEEVVRNQILMAARYRNILDMPGARIATLLRSSPPSMLVAFARNLFDQSYEQRFRNPARGHRLAAIALGAARRLRSRRYLGEQSQNDLEAEAWMFLANAKRVASNTEAAAKALETARQLLAEGSGDYTLKAQFYFFKAALRSRQGRVNESRRLWDKEIKLRRLDGNKAALGTALVGRGVIG